MVRSGLLVGKGTGILAIDRAAKLVNCGNPVSFTIARGVSFSPVSHGAENPLIVKDCACAG
jgi:hypothetical protein